MVAKPEQPQRVTMSTAGHSAREAENSSLVSDAELEHYLVKIDSFHRELHLTGFENDVRVPIDLEELYIPINSVVAHDQTFHCEDAEDDETVIPQAMKGVILLGDSGSGKTTRLKQMLLEAVSEAESTGLREGMVPVFLPLRHLRNVDAGLPGFIQQVLTDPLLGLARDFGERLCKRGKLMLLLDGLDEVANVEDRDRVLRWIQEARRAWPTNYFMVSSRFSSYTLDTLLDNNFVELHLQPMDSEQDEELIRKWYRLVERALADDEGQANIKAKARADDLLVTLRKPEMSSARVYTMTHNPLLLTTICLVHHDRGKLPDTRVLLYEEAVSVLLERWRRVTKDLEVTAPAREALRVLQPVAWWMHQSPGRIRASMDELEGPAKEGLEAIGRGAVEARQFLESIRDESGLLTGWGADEFGFMHLGFQEHLAAQAIQARAFDDPSALPWLAERFDNSWWQEVILLMLAQDHPPMFNRFMAEVVERVEFPEWARSALMEKCWNEALGVSPEPFADLLRQSGGGDTLGARQLAAAELLARRMPAALESLGDVLREHPSREVREWWANWTQREAEVEIIVAARGGVELVKIPGGTFLIGSPEREGCFDDEGPQHAVELSSFYLARTLVTNAQYQEYLTSNPGAAKPAYWGDHRYNQDNQPVVGVSWEEAQTYCAWAGLLLPTEAQWEYACRAGTMTRYHSGNSEEDLARVGWYSGNSGRRLHAVGELEPNAWGLYDMHGNVDEWCRDIWGSHEHACRMTRGGNISVDALFARSADRNCHPPEDRRRDLGFRPCQGID